jgi:hypothetical protein
MPPPPPSLSPSITCENTDARPTHMGNNNNNKGVWGTEDGEKREPSSFA